MDAKEVRQLLPPSSFESFDNILYSRVLGANRHINMIGKMLVDIIEHNENVEELIYKFTSVSKYYKETRGNQSRAVYNAINEMTYGFSDVDFSDVVKAKQKVIDQIMSYASHAEENVDKIIRYTNNIIENMDSVLIFDYSSTLNELLLKSKKKLNVYIAESRALDGGRPFVEASLKAGHKTHFFPDSTMNEVLKKCDVAFIGVESFYPDGTVFNTIGSDILALLCRENKKPLYALTPLIKVDERNAFGYTRLSPMPYDYGIKIAQNWDEKVRESVDFHGVKLVSVDPSLISGIVTEQGVIPPGNMYDIAMKYADKLKGDKNV